MARRSLEDRHIRSLTKVSSGASYGITIPKDYVHKLGWRSRQKLEVSLYRDRLIIRDWKPEKD